jgi:hypothetical protein
VAVGLYTRGWPAKKEWTVSTEENQVGGGGSESAEEQPKTVAEGERKISRRHETELFPEEYSPQYLGTGSYRSGGSNAMGGGFGLDPEGAGSEKDSELGSEDVTEESEPDKAPPEASKE